MKLNKVLVVEDDKSIQLITRVGLQDIGKVEVNIAENGKVGIELARSWKPDLILMDVMMPVMSGIEAIAIIKSDESLKIIPVVIMTAASKEEDIQKYLDMGACEVIIKPFNPTNISIKLKEIYERETN